MGKQSYGYFSLHDSIIGEMFDLHCSLHVYVFYQWIRGLDVGPARDLYSSANHQEIRMTCNYVVLVHARLSDLAL